jgi:DNA-binding NarL/FixJ family response regulator
VITVLIVDDNPIVRSALRGFLDSTDRVTVVGEAGNGHEALALARRMRPVVTLLDHRMPIADGLSVLHTLAGYTNVLALTSDESEAVIAGMLRGGARGYLVHGQFDPPDLLRAVESVAAGQGWLSPTAASVAAAAFRAADDRERMRRERAVREEEARNRFGLTPRERDVLNLLCEGLANASIARRLDLTEKTVKNHLHHVFAKLQVSSRAEAIVRWTGRRA